MYYFPSACIYVYIYIYIYVQRSDSIHPKFSKNRHPKFQNWPQKIHHKPEKSQKPKRVTPRKTNMSPKNQWLEDVFPIEIVPFLGDIRSFSGAYIFTGTKTTAPPCDSN